MKIGIVLNDVLREFSGQLEYTCNKYMKYGVPESEKFSIKDNPITKFDMVEYFGFPSKKEYHKFLFQEASLEIFGHADEMTKGLMVKLNEFIMDVEDGEEHEVILLSREVGASIPSTMFFLSKTLCKANHIKFYKNYTDQWEDVDVLITANPETLESKPDGKITVKIDTPYNTDVNADYSYNRAEYIFDSVDSINKITKPNTEEWIDLK